MFSFSEEHSTKVKNFMIDIMSPLISEADNFTTDILDLILINIVEPRKSQNKYAYQLAEQLIIKTADSLETIIKMVSKGPKLNLFPSNLLFFVSVFQSGSGFR